MLKLAQPLPAPIDALVLTESEKSLLQKYMLRIEQAQSQQAVAAEAMSDIGMAIAARAGRVEKQFKLSADFGFLVPVKE